MAHFSLQKNTPEAETDRHTGTALSTRYHLQAVFDRIRTLHEGHGIDSDYIIANTNGRVIAPTISKAMYRRGVEANINAKSIHALRRTVSSKLNSRLLSATVALIMGHTEAVNQTHYNYDIMELTIKKSAMEQICAIST